MEPRPVTEQDREKMGGVRILFKCPPGVENCSDVTVLKNKDSYGEDILMIPWVLDEIDLSHLAHGGVIWLHVYGSALPPVNLHIEPPL